MFGRIQLSLFFLIFCVFFNAFGKENTLKVFIHKNSIQQAGLEKVSVMIPDSFPMENYHGVVDFHDKVYPLFPSSKGLEGFIAADFDTPPGNYAVSILVYDGENLAEKRTLYIDVKGFKFPRKKRGKIFKKYSVKISEQHIDRASTHPEFENLIKKVYPELTWNDVAKAKQIEILSDLINHASYLNQIKRKKIKKDDAIIRCLQMASEEIHQQELKKEALKNLTSEKQWQQAFRWPVKSTITSPFGRRRVYFGKRRGIHRGIDLRAAVGRNVRAPEDGIVIYAGYMLATGNTLFIDHGRGIVTIYAHLSANLKQKGDNVTRGSVIAKAGNTGRSTAPHLHWGAYYNGILINPKELMRKDLFGK